MARPNLTWAVNLGAVDQAWTSAPNVGDGFVVVDLVSDKITFLDSQQTDGDLLTGERYWGIIPASGSVEVPKCFLEDTSTETFKEIELAGSSVGGGGDYRYVFSIYFSGATAGTPYLECWNTNTHTEADNAFLGGGVPASSTIRAIATTNGAPGTGDWAGTPLSGTDSRVSLDTGALGGAKTLYWNMRQVLPSTFVAQTDSNIVAACRFLYS
jgi:hypothetical protein